MQVANWWPALRRQFLLRLHDTDLWASYWPRVPGWSLLLLLVGFSLVAGAFVLFSAEKAAWRIAMIGFGLLLCLFFAWSAQFAIRNGRRRLAAREALLDAVSWRGDEAVLDVGCGSGMLLNGAAARLTTGTALGIDIWATHGGGGRLELLQKHARAENVAERISFQAVDARQMPFENASFDVVLSSWAVHHIIHSGEDFDNLIHEMLRVLRPRGTLVVMDVAHLVQVLADRLQAAGLQVELRTGPAGQQFVVGRNL